MPYRQGYSKLFTVPFNFSRPIYGAEQRGMEQRERLFLVLGNLPFPSYFAPLFQNESSCKTFHMKISLIYVKMNL